LTYDPAKKTLSVAATANGLDDAIDRRQIDERARGVVDENDPRFIRQIVEAIRHGFHPCPAARRHHQAIDVALKEPRRRIPSVPLWQHAHDAADGGVRHERLDAVQQHRLPRYPAELLQPGAPNSRSRANRDYYHADVARRHAKRR